MALRSFSFLMLSSFSLGVVGCSGKDTPDSGADLEPLVLPDDPAEFGVPVGVRTVRWGNHDVEVWYPAADASADETPESVALADLLPESVLAALGTNDLPVLPTRAVRDAPLRATGTSFPVVFFSHGFGGFAAQSVDITAHLASRGYVVFSTEHAGRSIRNLLPCLFSPPLEGCSLSVDDSGPADIQSILTALEATPDFLEGAVDTSKRAIMGHSAGGMTSVTLANEDPTWNAAVILAAPPAVTSDVPVLAMDGTCDSIIPEADVAAAFADVPNGTRLALDGAGHLAFSDICTFDLGGLADTLLLPRDDINTALIGQLVQLGTDGCPGATVAVPTCGDSFLPLTDSGPVLRGNITLFLDQHLRDQSQGVTGDVPAFVTLSTTGG